MANDSLFTDEEMSMNQALGYPEAYAKICGEPSFRSFSHGPPFTFTPYSLSHQEVPINLFTVSAVLRVLELHFGEENKLFRGF